MIFCKTFNRISIYVPISLCNLTNPTILYTGGLVVELLKIAFEIGSYMSRFCFAIFRNPTTLYNRIASMEWWDY